MSILNQNIDIPLIPFFEQFRFRVYSVNAYDDRITLLDESFQRILSNRCSNVLLPSGMGVKFVMSCIKDIVFEVALNFDHLRQARGIDPTELNFEIIDTESYKCSHDRDAIYKIRLTHNGNIYLAKTIFIDKI